MSMFQEGDWVKLVHDEPNLGLNAGMLAEVTMVHDEPSGNGFPARTYYTVQFLTDGFGFFAPITARAPQVGEENEFIRASPGEILFATGAQALKDNFIPPEQPAAFSSPPSPSPVVPSPPTSLPAKTETPSDNNNALLLLLLPLLFSSKDFTRLVKTLLILILVFVVAITIIIAFAPKPSN